MCPGGTTKKRLNVAFFFAGVSVCVSKLKGAHWNLGGALNFLSINFSYSVEDKFNIRYSSKWGSEYIVPVTELKAGQKM